MKQFIIYEVNGFITVSSGEDYNFSGTMEKPEWIIAARDHLLWQRAYDVVNSQK